MLILNISPHVNDVAGLTQHEREDLNRHSCRHDYYRQG